MIANSPIGNGTFSADVKSHHLRCRRAHRLGQLGPDFALLRDPQTIDIPEGEIETIIDEQVSRWPIRITSPITSDSRRFTFEAVG